MSAPSITGPPTGPGPLLVTADETLLDDLLRLAAAAGVTLDVAHDTRSALRAWSTTPVVLVGTDLAARMAGEQPVRRDQVHVVGHAPTPDDVFRSALAVGAEHVAELPMCETWLVELLTDVADGGSGPGCVVAVAGGSGGSGATTFAAALALTASREGRRALLLDADPLGPGIDRVVGMDDLDGVRWDALPRTGGRFGARSLRGALPQRDGLAVLTWAAGDTTPLEPFVLREALSAARQGNDVVVVDLPRLRDPIVCDLLGRCDQAVLVAGLTVPAVSAAARTVEHLMEGARRVGLVARGRPGAARAEDVAGLLGLDLLAVMPDQRRLAESVDLGLGPLRSRRGPLAVAARSVLAEVTSATVSAA